MPRRTVAAASLAASGLLVGLLPGLVGPVAGSSCSAWTSETVPPPTIRVFRHASGTVDTVSFKPYTKNVLSREWIGSWTTESLRSGALLVRNYAWYQVLHWRGGVDASGRIADEQFHLQRRGGAIQFVNLGHSDKTRHRVQRHHHAARLHA